MLRIFEVHDISEAQARAVMETELPLLMHRLIRKAHKEGSRGRTAEAQFSFEGTLFDAAVRLPDEFEASLRSCVGSKVWNVIIGYSVRNYAPYTVTIRLK